MTFGNLSFGRITDKLSIAPLLLILASRVLTNCFPLIIGYEYATKVSLPINTWACLTPLSTAGVSEKIVSVATGSCLLGMLSAGFLYLRCLFIGKVKCFYPILVALMTSSRHR